MRTHQLLFLSLLLGCTDAGGLAPVDTGEAQCSYYRDADGDSYGNPDVSITEPCSSVPDGYVTASGDCDDLNAAISPVAAELCDGVDNDCDGAVDPSSAVDAATWYLDDDDDGYGVEGDTLTACDEPSGYGANEGDCDDNNNGVYPGAEEYCDELDNDCDGTVDNVSGSECVETLEDDGSICAGLTGSDLGSVPTWTGNCNAGQGYVSYGDHCYFAVWDLSATWLDARTSCAAAGGWLATVADDEENEFLAGQHDRFFLGGCDADQEGTWTWITGEAWIYETWADGAPDNDGGDEHCLVEGTENHWNDTQATSTKDGFICEFNG